ncbi:Myb-like DNA-binding domain-containing protein [Spironucleus salmonicida]|uniref:Myb-like DNA-binding domain-containing protein n=1 Tax=Spironucleus salmonicida TaxID=348837 RepID=V6LCT5_9EUKA|nr:Myb-like DNA-binding domain-containing protein [Spironucleus salmonicida]|eukprot:EST42295.1 Myb-like DNA-binding domain-containing protein [Spironucleus salmonicida]
MTAHQWTYVEEERLISQVHIYGQDWRKIQENAFPRLTVLKLKNKWYKLRKQDVVDISISPCKTPSLDNFEECDLNMVLRQLLSLI